MSNGRFGRHGGQFIPETLMNAIMELEDAYNKYKNDKDFNNELNELLREYVGRPSRLYYAEKMTKDLGGAKIYLKREDLNHTGSHKLNNALAQVLLAKKMGKIELTETEVELISSNEQYAQYMRQRTKSIDTAKYFMQKEIGWPMKPIM